MSLDLDLGVSLHEPSKQYAVVIGINKYEDNKIADLDGPSKDATNLVDVLENPDIADYEVLPFINGPSQHILKQIEILCLKVKENDTILFYFAGHGYMLDSRNDLYMMASDSRLDSIRSTSISGFMINEILSSTRCKNQLMVLDCCHAGAFARSLRSSSVVGGRVIIAATDEQEGAVEVTGKSGLKVGVFSHAFTHGLRKGGADLDGNGFISALEIYQYCSNVIRKSNYRQNTMLWTLGVTQDLIVAKNCAHKDSENIFEEGFG